MLYGTLGAVWLKISAISMLGFFLPLGDLAANACLQQRPPVDLGGEVLGGIDPPSNASRDGAV